MLATPQILAKTYASKLQTSMTLLTLFPGSRLTRRGRSDGNEESP